MYTPEISAWPTATEITYGDPLSASTLSGGSASADGTFVFDDPDYVPDAAGTYNAAVTFVPADLDTYDPVNGTVPVTVNKAPLTIKADDKSKTYGDDPVFTASYDGFKRGDTPAVVSDLTFSREEGEDVGSYTITPYGATANNYDITFVEGTLTIEPAPLTITAENKSKTYGDADPAFTVTYDGFKRGETAEVVSGLTVNRDAGEDVGSYTITPYGATADNYDITFVEGILTIEPAPLTITAEDKSKVYGDPDPAFTVSYNGFRRGDTVEVVSGLTISRAPGENAGEYTIIPAGAMAQNYAITHVNGTLTINPAPLTIKADDKSKTYGDDDPVITASYDGFKRGDTAEVVSGLTITRETGEDVGQYTITPSGAMASNYDISYASGTLTINPALLTIKADDKSKTYGDDDPVFTASYDGFKRGDTAEVVSGLTISREPGEDVGQYVLTPSGATASNYTISYENGTLTIEKAPLTITAEDKSKVYGDADPAFTVSYKGLKHDDTPEVVSGLTISRAPGEDAGEYAIIPAGATAQNYVITHVNGTLTIEPAPLTIKAENKSKTYDGTPYTTFTVSYDSFVSGEDENVLGGSLKFEGTAVGAVNAGTYTIVPTGLTSGNYEITYVNGTLTIDKAPLTIAAENKSKTYDGIPYDAFTVSYDGFVSGEDESVLGGSLAFEGTAVGAVDAGAYTILPKGLTSDNYDIEFVEGTLTIEKATPEILSWPEAAAIIYGDTLEASSLSMGITSVSGNFAFDDPDARPGAGLQDAAVTFTPDDTQNYNTVSGTVQIAVNYSLALDAGSGGAVDGAGAYLPGVVTIKAVPDAGYRFVCWSENGAIISDDAEYSFTLNSNRNLEAVFWEYDAEKTGSQTGIETTGGKAKVDFHGGKVSIEITASDDLSGGQIDVTLYDTDKGKGAPKGKSPAGIYLRIERTDNLAGSTMRLVVNYDPDTLPKGMKETDLKLYRYVPETGWVVLSPQGVNTAENHIWAEVSDFSTFAVFGATPSSPGKALPETGGLRLCLILGAALIAIAGLCILLRRKMRIES